MAHNAVAHKPQHDIGWQPTVAAFGESPESIAKRAAKLASTSAQGVPSKYTSSFEWARDWVKENGVTLPPDTPQLRSLRNWFCYKMSQFKKGALSDENRRLLAEHGIDLSLYEAPNTGRGKSLPEREMVAKLRAWRDAKGTYDLTDEADPALVLWQRKLCGGFELRGRSGRMRDIEAQLEGLDIARWVRPDGRGAVTDPAWWLMAEKWRQQSLETPAYRGDLDPLTPPELARWAQKQASNPRALNSRQVGELLSLGLLPDRDRARQRVREAATTVVRESLRQTLEGYGYRERSLGHYLGVCLYLRLITQETSLRDIYATLAITPSAHCKLLEALKPIMEDILTYCTRDLIGLARAASASGSEVIDIAQDFGDQESVPEAFSQAMFSFLKTTDYSHDMSRVREPNSKVLSRLWVAFVTIGRASTRIRDARVRQDLPETVERREARIAVASARRRMESFATQPV